MKRLSYRERSRYRWETLRLIEHEPDGFKKDVCRVFQVRPELIDSPRLRSRGPEEKAQKSP
jgi:hypothetical protein